MEMLNRAIEDADAFSKMRDKLIDRQGAAPGGGNRQQRRAEERAALKVAKRAKKAGAPACR